MQNNYLITPSLLNSFAYFINYDEAKQADKYGDNYKPKTDAEMRAEFLKTLSREKSTPNEAMQKGVDFENDVQLATDSFNQIDIHHEDYDERQHIVNQIAKIVKGGIWQTVVSKPLKIGSVEYLLYGKTDVIKENTIYDIKFTTNGSNYDVGKYQNSAQHRIYLYCSGLPKFAYLISDDKNFWREDYANNSKIEDEIKSMISDFISYLKADQEAAQLFYGRWNANR